MRGDGSRLYGSRSGLGCSGSRFGFFAFRADVSSLALVFTKTNTVFEGFSTLGTDMFFSFLSGHDGVF